MNILVTGTTGFIGKHITSKLLDEGHDVIACVRNPREAINLWPDIKTIETDFTKDHAISTWSARLQQIDVVINTVGIIHETRTQKFNALHNQTPCALFKACSEADVKKVVQISALGADDTAFSQYHLSKKKADQCLMEQSTDWTILMPSIVYGPGAKSMTFFKALASLPVIPLVDDGSQKIQPVHINDMVRVVQEVIHSDKHSNCRIEVVGPEPITMKRLYTTLNQWLGIGKLKFLPVPYKLSLQLARLGGFIGNTPMNPEAVQMLQKGNTADIAPLVDRFGFIPKSLEDSLTELPAQQSDRWHASLFFLKPLLRISIAFLWIVTGIISAFIFPVEQSYEMLAKAGITGVWAPTMLFGAAITDLLLGIATFKSYRLRTVGWLQISIMLLYTVIISFSQPEQWMHPFGPVTKNIPLIMATLMMITLEKK